MPFRLLTPKSLDSAQRYPLVLFLHGAGERGDDNQAQLTHGVQVFASEEARRRFPCFVAAPQCANSEQWVNQPWNLDVDSNEQDPQPSLPLKMALTLLSDLQVRYPVDPDQIHITGLSMGGFGTWDALTRHPRLFASAVPICGGGDVGRVKATYQAGVAIWAFHGACDQVVPVRRSRAMIEALRRLGARIKYTEYPDVAHDAWTKAYGEPDLLSWIFSQRRT